MKTLPNITPEIIKAYQDSLVGTGSPATAKRKTASLNQFFGWAQSAGKISQNPLAKPTIPASDAVVINPFNVTSVKKSSKKTWVTIGLTTALIVLIFLLTFKLKFPIPFTLNFAQEADIQTPLRQGSAGQALPQNSNDTIPVNPANNAVISAWNLYTKLKLMDSAGSPLVGPQSLGFKIFDTEKDGVALYTSPTQNISTDANGSVLISIDDVPTDLFFQNNTLYLEPQIGNGQGSSLSASFRIPVSTANTPAIDRGGNIVLTDESPSIKAQTGNFLLEGQAVTIKTADGGDGDIEINPDGSGIAHFLFEGSKGNFLNAQGPNLTSGSLYYGMVPNNATGYDLIRLQSGSPKMTTKFSVDALGNTYIAGDLNVTNDIATGGVDRLTSAGALKNITGYSQNSGNFTITQNPGDFASITKKGSALSDVLNLTLDERNFPNSSYSTLTLNRFNGAPEAAALHVDEGNAIFDGQIELGRFNGTPDAIGQGSLVFNTADNLVYFYDGSTWNSLGSGGSAFSAITSGTNTTATMIVGSGATLSTSGTGTITATDLVCSGCVSATDVADDSLDFAQFQDALDLDAATDIALGALTLSTSGTGALNFASTGQVTFAGNVDATNGLDVTGANLTVGGANFTVNQANGDVTTAGDVAVNGGDLTTTSSTFNLLAGATTLNIGPTGSGASTVVVSGGSADTGCTFDGSNGNLTCSGVITGSAASSKWNAITDPDGDLTLTMAAYNSTFNWDPGADSAETNFSLTTQGEDTTGGGDEDQVLLALSQTSNGADVDEAADALITLTNNDANDPVNSAIRFNAGAAGTDFTYGINFDAASIGTAELILQNGETIDNVVDGTVAITATNTALSGDLAVNDGDITTTAATFNVANAATTLNLGSTNVTRTINIGTGTSADTINIGTGGTTAENITIGTTTASNSLALNDDNWNITGAGLANFVSIGAATPGTGAFTTLTSSGSTTLGTGASSINTIGSTTTPGTLTLHGATTLDNTFTVSGSNLTTLGADLYVASGISTFSTAVSDGTVEATQFCTGDGETNCVTDFSSIIAGASYWSRTAGNLYPTTLNDTLSATTSAAVALTLTQTGAFNALLVEDELSDTTPFVIDQSGNVGIGDTGPDAKLEVLSTTEQLRLTYTDGTVDSRFTVDSSGDLTINNTGTQTIIANDLQIQGGDLTVDDTTFNLVNTTATTLNIGGAATTINQGPTGASGSIVFSGGSADTGCTLDGVTGDFTCSGNFITTATTGTQGWWQRNLGVLSPANITDDLTIGGIATASAKFQVISGTGNITSAGDLALNGGDLTSTATTFNFDVGDTGTLNFRDGTNTLVTISDQGTTGRLAVSDALQVGGLTTVAYSRFGTTAAGHTGNITASDDLMISGDLELDGNLYLDGKNIYNTNGNAAIILCTGGSGVACATTSAQQNTLSTGSWVIDNQVNVGEPVLALNNAKGGDLLVASASGVLKFRVDNVGDAYFGDNSGTDLTVGGGTGKIDVGTIDPPYTINGKKFATFLSGIVGVKEEVVGQATTSEYVPGIGYRYLIDFNSLPEGSDLWLFSKATDIKTNINKLVALLTPSDPTRVWYEVDKENKRLAIYSARPTTISYRLTGPRFDHESWSNIRSEDSVAGFVLNIPDLVNNNPIVSNLQNMSDFVISKVQDGYYQVKDSGGNVVDGVESIGNFVAGNIKSGAIATGELATNSFTAFQGTVDSLLITTGLVTPEAKIALISPIPGGKDITVKIGDGNNPGKLAIKNDFEQEVASIDSEGNARLQGDLTARQATFAGDVHAQNIDEIESILNQVSADQNFLTQIVNSNINTATNSASLSQLATIDLYVTGQAAINSLSVTSSIAIGSDLVLNSVDSSLNTLSSPLRIQSLALAPVEIMNGLVTIDTSGNVNIAGNLYVAGKITTPQLDADIINTGDLTAQGLIIGAADATESGVIANGEINTNSTIGKAVVPAGVSEITIRSPKVNDYSLIYVTPTSDTANNTLYIKSKQAGQFVVGFTNAIPLDVSFNWWVVQIQ